MNEHPGRHYLYVTPYLTEAKRIADSCPALEFVEPSNRIPDCDFSKTAHVAKLLRAGRNIASTHQLFSNFTSEMLEVVADMRYSLIIDEDVALLETVGYDHGDIQLLLDAGYVIEDGSHYRIADGVEYGGKFFAEFFRKARSRDIVLAGPKGSEDLFCFWMLRPDLLCMFEDVFVMTFMYRSQDIRHMIDMYRLPHMMIGTMMCDDGKYRFVAGGGVIPEYAAHIREHVHVLENERLNSIGDDASALSLSWFERNPELVKQLSNKLVNYFTHYTHSEAKDRLWSTFSSFKSAVAGRRYLNQFVAFNARATNEYRDRSVLAYLCNVYMNVDQKNYYRKCGIEVNDDEYALSNLVQWMWRGAIRDGKDIDIYIPSRRMRNLLNGWMVDIEGEYRRQSIVGKEAVILE